LGGLRDSHGDEPVIIYGIEEPDLRAALEVANYAYEDNLRFEEGPEPLTVRRQDWRMQLGVENLDGPGSRPQVPRTWWDKSWWDRKARPTYWACYHAHRDFLYAVFERAPDARVVTALAVYEGLKNFESTYRRTGGLNVGSFFEPVRFEDCCECLKRYPQIEEMVPEAQLGEEYALKPERGIYSGLNASERR
jgi:hypothetical protein